MASRVINSISHPLLRTSKQRTYSPGESQSKPETKMVDPEPCKEQRWRRSAAYPGFECGSDVLPTPQNPSNPFDSIASGRALSPARDSLKIPSGRQGRPAWPTQLGRSVAGLVFVLPSQARWIHRATARLNIGQGRQRAPKDVSCFLQTKVLP